MTYISSYKGQDWLLPVSIKQMIPENHISFFVEEFVESMDFSRFDMINEGAGHPAYHPRIIMKIIIQGMLSKERSSRKLASACRENFVFMYLAEKVQPNFRTIARFRKNNASFVKEAFKETINLASEHDLVDLSVICLDGTTIKANANTKKCIKRNQLEAIGSIVDRMVEEDIKQDDLDEKEENMTEMDKRDFKQIVNEYRNAKDKERIKEKIEKIKEEAQKDEKMANISSTDPECRMMQNKKGLNEFSYNAQFGVDSKHQIIIANDVCQDRHDSHQFIPQMRNIQENVELRNGSGVVVDCGYDDAENMKFAEDEKIELYMPNSAQIQGFGGEEKSRQKDNYKYDKKRNELIVEGERYQFRGVYDRKDGKKVILFYSEKLKKKRQVPFFFEERLRMKEKMETEEAKEIYQMRKIVVEPVIGDIKENYGFTKFYLRGLEKVKIELNLISIAHNLKKIYMLRGKIKSENESYVKKLIFI
ncbi:MAG: IS1182 family transposase [Nanoarchaeota archaeon]|nr:IS1182 family transposase [Nanoarchaeota archaeon]